MREKLLSTAAAVAIVVGIGGYAMAADMPTKAFSPAPMAPPVTWAGWYFGGHLGWGTSKVDGNVVDPGDFTYSASVRPQGSLLGLQSGYNWQAGQVVYGFESDVTVTPGWKKNVGEDGPPSDDTGVHGEVHGLATVRGRLGWAFDQRWLAYGTAGVAWASTTNMAGTSQQHFVALAGANTRTGWVAGGGVEYKYNPTVSMRLEALYYGFNHTETIACGDCGASGFHATTGLKNVAVVRFGVSWYPQPW